MAEFPPTVFEHKPEMSGEFAADTTEYLRCYFNSSGQIAIAGAANQSDGVCRASVDVSENAVGTLFKRVPGMVVKMVAAGALTKGEFVYPAADGKVDDVVTGEPEGIALAAASGNNSMIPVLMLGHTGFKSRIFKTTVTVSSGQAAANSGDGRADISTGFGATPAGFLAIVRNASDNVQNTGYVMTTTGTDSIRIDGVAAGVQLDENDVIHVMAWAADD